MNDTTENMYHCITLLEAVIRRNMYARFTTLIKARIFSLQLVCTTLTLSTARLDPSSPGKFIVQQHRSAELPASSGNQLKWYKVFELVSALMTMLQEQSLISGELGNESSGAMDIDVEDYVSIVLRL